MNQFLNNSRRANIALFALANFLLLGTAALSNSAFAGTECAEFVKYDGDLEGGRYKSIKRTSLSEYAIEFWVERVGGGINDPSAKTIIHAGNTTT